jgi:hypothetical protein
MKGVGTYRPGFFNLRAPGESVMRCPSPGPLAFPIGAEKIPANPTGYGVWVFDVGASLALSSPSQLGIPTGTIVPAH